MAIIASAILLSCRLECAHGFSPNLCSEPSRNARRAFIQTIATGIISAAASTPRHSNAIEFVPPSPYFSGTYRDAIEIINAQRLAINNIADVVKDGKLEEAGFKAMQLNAQTRVAGRIVLDTFQEGISSPNAKKRDVVGGISGNGNDSVLLLRYLSCQKKLALLLDLCDECEVSLQKGMKGGYGAEAAAQLRILGVVDETRGAYDDFLADVVAVEKSVGRP